MEMRARRRGLFENQIDILGAGRRAAPLIQNLNGG
jgi:hypothetical protein